MKIGFPITGLPLGVSGKTPFHVKQMAGMEKINSFFTQ